MLLTKPIGTGIISTGIKFGKAKHETANYALGTMAISAREASIAMTDLCANACTDITGFGLMGHAFEMAKASEVTLQIDSKKVPLLPEVLELIDKKMLTRGDKTNRAYVGETATISDTVSPQMQSALFDPQTAGGLLISLEPEKAEEYVKRVEGTQIIGRVKVFNKFLIEVL